MCFEEALLLSALYDAVPMPSFEACKKQFLLESHENERVSALNNISKKNTRLTCITPTKGFLLYKLKKLSVCMMKNY